ncbi:MAG: DUF262 domain-containing protein [Campylobacterota bacterium]
MKASEIKLEEFLSQPKTNFIIPVYQRNYDWKKEQCNDFITDVEALVKRERETHFLGTIVYIKGDDLESIESGLKEYIIIDGQQRITTTMLFLKAIYDLSDDIDDKEEIRDDFLIIKRSNKLKLKPIKDDNFIFEKLLNNEIIDENNTSRIYKNYQYFKEYLIRSTIDIEKYFKTFRRIWVVYIELDRTKDDPQLIFESINSTGLSLSEADLIRNFILMDKKHDEQNYLFEEYWSKIEKLLLSENISAYIRDYLTMKENKIPNQKDVYNSFKNYVSSSNLNSEELLTDLLYHAKNYSRFLFLNFEIKEIEQLLKEIKDLKVTVSYPFLLRIFEDFDKGIISSEILVNCIQLIRNYIFRRLICEYNTNALNKIFMILYKELTEVENFTENYYECLASVLLDKRSSGMYPRDEEFKDYFTTKDIYKFKNKNYLLYKLECFENKEVVPMADLTIEHIMPQTLTAKWNVELGDKFSQVHEQLLHNIGNLTFSGYNANLSNKSFSEKKVILKESNVGLNKYFNEIKYWTKEEIEKRADYLFEKIALNIWKFPGIDENKFINKDEQEYYNLNESFDVTGKKIKKINILGDNIAVSSWIQCFAEFSNTMYNIDNSVFSQLAYDDDFKGREKRIISDNIDELRKPHKFNDNVHIYIESNLSANSILNYIKILAEKYELYGDDVVFYIA